MGARILFLVVLAAGAVGFLAGRQTTPVPRDPEPLRPLHPVELMERQRAAEPEPAPPAPSRASPSEPRPKPPVEAPPDVAPRPGDPPDLYVGSLVATPNGTLKIVRGKEGYGLVRHGLWTEFHESGAKAGECEYRDGVPDGPTTTWHENGAVHERGAWRTGRKHGTWTTWDDTGALVGEEVWDDGMLVRTAEVPEPGPAQVARATVDGKYGHLLVRVPAPGDRKSYGEFRDYGKYQATDYAGVKGIPEGYWVYVYPWWYIFRDKLK